MRSKPEFALIYDADAKNYKITLSQANLYVRKMTVSDQLFNAIEKTLTKTLALYRYTEVLPKTYLIPQGSRSWSKQDIFSKEPIRRFALALISNQAFLGSQLTNPFHHQRHDLSEVTVNRMGSPIAGTPISTDDEKRVYMTKTASLAFGYHGHGIPFLNYTNHFVVVFDRTSTQKAPYEFLYPEVTNAAVSEDLKISTAMPGNTEVFLGRNGFYNIY